MSVLYSGIGTTDPVRGMRDGGLMHIMRFYRPDTVYLFLSEEIIRRDKQDDRINKTFDFIRANWDGYDPKVIRYETDIADPSDMDALMEPMEALLESIAANHPQTEILLNLSSGTPQMQILLAQMALATRYKTRGIQVKSPERQSGTAERTNIRNFPVDEALELNEDEESGQPNRCCEPRMIAMRRETVRHQLQSLVSRRNYAAIAQMGADLPAPYPQLARHLASRSRFLLDKAEQDAKGLTFPWLKGRFPDPVQQRREYRTIEMVEYFGMLKHLVYLHRYTEFVLRLNPFLVKLELALLDSLVQPLGFREWDLIPNVGNRKKISPTRIANLDPGLKTALETSFSGALEERDVSIQALTVMLGYYGMAADELQLLRDCDTVNTRLRNDAAHDFLTITDDMIQLVCGRNADQIVRGLEPLLLRAAEPCRSWGLEQRLNVYREGDKLLRNCL